MSDMKKHIFNFKEKTKKDRIMFYLLFTIISNLFFAILKLIFGLWTFSIWFIINAIFYIIISIARIFSIRDYIKIRYENSEKMQEYIGYKNYFNNGILLVLLGIIYIFISVYMLNTPVDNNMKGYIVYGVAFMAFWSLVSSIYGMVKYRKKTDPILSAVKVTNYSNSLTSIVLTQVVLLDNFGEELDYAKVNSLAGIIMGLVIVLFGVSMVFGIKRLMKRGVHYD